jgi:hypothetical protein
MENKEKHVVVGIPNGSGFMPALMVNSLLGLRKPDGCVYSILIVDRLMIEKARNEIVAQAIANGGTHLLFIDDDNPVPPDTIEKLLEDDKDIVIAPILGRHANERGEHKLCAFYEADVEGVRGYDKIERFRDDGYLHKIDAGGTGCMMIKIEVLKKLQEKYENRIFESTRTVLEKPIVVRGKVLKERTMSEDVEFCERARDAGFEVWLDSRVRPFHIAEARLLQYGVL